MSATEDGQVVDHGEYLDVCVGQIQLQRVSDGKWIIEEDFRVDGEIWRVHKNDADPFPSNPHAHCVGGAKRFIGLTLHLGTGELFRSRASTGRRLGTPQFERLIQLIQPKFPHIRLPLPA